MKPGDMVVPNCDAGWSRLMLYRSLDNLYNADDIEAFSGVLWRDKVALVLATRQRMLKEHWVLLMASDCVGWALSTDVYEV